MPLFSVLLSVYAKERPEYLRQSLNSIYAQTCLPDEVVLVEDGPLTDELYQVINEYERLKNSFHAVPLLQNGGLGRALNEGLKHCSYELVARMDTDDIAMPNRFERQLKVMEQHPEYDAVGAWISEFEGTKSNVRSIRKLPEFPDELFRFGKKRNPLSHPVVMFRKSAVLQAGGYKHCPSFEDYYTWARMLMNEAKFYNIQESLLWFRVSAEMYKRRGGWSYAFKELKFQRILYRLRYINKTQLLKNCTIRFTARIIPNAVRGMIYKKIVRR